MQEDKFKNLYEKLQEQDWPSVYMFKFIAPADNKKLGLLESMVNSNEAIISRKVSKKGTYVSVTIQEMMISAEEVIARYRAAAEIQGVISL